MSDERSPNLPLYESGLTSEPLTLQEASILTVGRDEAPKKPRFRGDVHFANSDSAEDIDAIEAINLFYWGSLEQDIFGRVYHVLDCRNMLARPLPDEPGAIDDSIHGIAGQVSIFEEDEGFLHIVVFNVWPQWHGRGTGKKLLGSVIRECRRLGLPSIKLGTTNDNIPALYFYQRSGFVIEEVVPGEVVRGHTDAPVGYGGIPVRDEIRMRLDLGDITAM
ncbi:MAG: GNAT family N-acetyltransferase [bacterium]|nr:GNAT family N-acetyltransferase [bacterium]